MKPSGTASAPWLRCRPVVVDVWANETNHHREEAIMLWTITILLFTLWLIGVVSSYTAGGLIHLLLLLAIVTMLVRIIQGRRPV
jgi:hypothetical protein